MTKEVIVESFELDHTAVKAPYVRLIGEETGPKGDIISNFDIRLVQPNENAIPTAGLHTIEHLLAMLIRKRIDGMIDCSPFGCRTGFHMIMWGQHSSTEIAKVIKDSLEEIASYVEQEGKKVFVFSADWCGDCRYLKPFLPEIEAENPEFTFILIDRDAYMDLAKVWDVYGIPSLVVLEKDKEIGRFVNRDRKTKAQITAFLAGLK